MNDKTKNIANKCIESSFTKIKDEITSGFGGIMLICVVLPSLGILGVILIGLEVTNADERFTNNEIAEKEITARINSGNIDCQYVTDLRMKYDGDSFVNALDDSWINSKLRIYWNTHACGVEWNWWD